MRKKGERNSWLHARRVLPILIELAKHPLTPEILRVRTGMRDNNYVNFLLRRLKSEGLVECVNPQDKVGRVFCIKHESEAGVQQLFRRAAVKQDIPDMPALNWRAYGRLLCEYCKQMRPALLRAHELNLAGKKITMQALRARLPGVATQDVFRALGKLVKLGVLSRKPGKPITFEITDAGRRILGFRSELLLLPAEPL